MISTLHHVHEKTITLYTLPQLWQTTWDFNEILHQHCEVKLQTRHQILAKAVNISATATASLVRSLKSISVHYRHRRDWLSSVRLCEWQDFSTSKVCVQNVHRVHEVERKLQDMDTTAWPLYRWPLGGNVPTLRSGATSTGRRHVAAVHTILQLPPNLVVDWVKVRTVGWPQRWGDEVWCFMS